MSALTFEEKLASLGHSLPILPTAGGNYLSAKIAGSILYLAGVISTDENGVLTGTVGQDRTVEEGYQAAVRCALTQLAVMRQELGSLDRLVQIVSVNGYVNAVSGFADTPGVINGASDLLIALFGESGRHVRAAVGVAALPRNAMVELQMTAEIA